MNAHASSPAVLIVDDDDAIRETIRFALEEEGYVDVLEAPDGMVALRLLRDSRLPLVVLCDHHMPRLDGQALMDFVAKDDALRHRHAFLYMTAADRVLSPSFAQQLARLGVPILRKPFDLHALFAAAARAADSLRGRAHPEAGDPAAATFAPVRSRPSHSLGEGA
jgi:CheY-like chemotaxis protein